MYNLFPRGCHPFGQHHVSAGNEDSGGEIQQCRDLGVIGVKKMADEQ